MLLGLEESQWSAYPVGTHLLCVSQHAPHARPGYVVSRCRANAWYREGGAYRSRFDSSDMAIDCARDFFEFRVVYDLNENRCTVVARRLEKVHDV